MDECDCYSRAIKDAEHKARIFIEEMKLEEVKREIKRLTKLIEKKNEERQQMRLEDTLRR